MKVKQCDASNQCSRCTSNKHSTSNCPGSNNGLHKPCKFCNKNEHVGCLCPTRPVFKPRVTDNNVCLSTSVPITIFTSSV